MKDSENTNIVLRRCKTMNCVHEGQSFSLGIMDGDLGGRKTTEATIQTMLEAELLAPGLHGTYILTEAGAQAISGLVAAKKPSHVRSGAWQSRKPTEKAS